MIIDAIGIFDAVNSEIISRCRCHGDDKVRKYVEFLNLAILYYATYDYVSDTRSVRDEVEKKISHEIARYVSHNIEYDIPEVSVYEEDCIYDENDIVSVNLIATLDDGSDTPEDLVMFISDSLDETFMNRREVDKFCNELASDILDICEESNVDTMDAYYTIAKWIRNMYYDYTGQNVTLSDRVYIDLRTMALIIS